MTTKRAWEKSRLWEEGEAGQGAWGWFAGACFGIRGRRGACQCAGQKFGWLRASQRGSLGSGGWAFDFGWAGHRQGHSQGLTCSGQDLTEAGQHQTRGIDRGAEGHTVQHTHEPRHTTPRCPHLTCNSPSLSNFDGAVGSLESLGSTLRLLQSLQFALAQLMATPSRRHSWTFVLHGLRSPASTA